MAKVEDLIRVLTHWHTPLTPLLPPQVIQQHPPRAETDQKISELEAQLASLLESRQTLERKLELRRRQFHVLLTSIHHLQSLLSKEEEGEREGEEPVAMETT